MQCTSKFIKIKDLYNFFLQYEVYFKINKY